MYTKTIKFHDLDGNEVIQDFYFNFTETELSVMELSQKGGLIALANKITNEKDGEKLMKLFQELILSAYGIKSSDNIHFLKEDPIDHHKYADDFKQTDAYNQLFLEFARDDKAASDFFNGVIPKAARDQVDKMRDAEELPGQKNYKGPEIVTNIADKINQVNQ